MVAARIAPTAGDGVALGIPIAAALTGDETVLVNQAGVQTRYPLSQLTWVGAPAVTLLQAKAAISRLQFTTLSSAPVPIVPAPGPGKVIVVMALTVLYTAGSHRFSNANASLTLQTGGNASFVAAGTTNIQGLTASMAMIGGPGGALLADSINSALFVGANVDPGVWGPIGTATVGAAGTGYAVGDTGTLVNGGGDATYRVTSVNGSGGVTGFTLTNPGSSYTTTPVANTGTGGTHPGVGTGFKASIVVTDCETGTAEVHVLYYITDAMT